MKVSISWWELSGSGQTIDSLRAYLRDEAAPAWAEVKGLRVKFWISDRPGNRWGAVMVWESEIGGDGDQQLPPHRAAELIGYPPTERLRFDVEATVEGLFTEPRLAGLGLALEAGRPTTGELTQRS